MSPEEDKVSGKDIADGNEILAARDKRTANGNEILAARGRRLITPQVTISFSTEPEEGLVDRVLGMLIQGQRN